jgi:phage tail tube protein FII
LKRQHNGELNNLYCSDIVRMTKLGVRMQEFRYGGMKSAYRIFVGNSLGKGSLETLPIIVGCT